MGGDGRVLVNEISDWANTNNIERITRARVKEYTTKNNIQINKSLEGQIVRDLKKNGESFSYIRGFEK